MEDIQASFEAKYNIRLELIPGASGTLTNQILHGAPFDVFIPADKKYSQILHDKGLLTEAPLDLIKGSLVLWSDQPITSWSDESYAPLTSHLTSSKVQTIAIAQPGLAPFGDAAKDFLQHIEAWDLIDDKIVYGNNVSITNQYIYTRGANIVITSLATKIRFKESIPNYWYEINGNSNLTHTLCLLMSGKPASNQFLNYLSEAESKSIFIEYGYMPIVQ